MSNINPDPFTTRPEIEGTFGVVTSTHWIATAVGMAHAGKRRQRLRRRRRHRLHAAGGRAASERPGRRRAGHRPRRQARPHRGDLRPGPRAREGAPSRTTRAKAWRWCPAPACSPPACPARSTPGCCCCATTARCGCATCWSPRSPMPRDGYPLVERACGDDPGRREIVPQALADLGGGLSAERRSAEARHAVHQQAARRNLRAHPARRPKAPARDRVAQIERARKAWSQGFVAEAIDKFCRTQEVMDVSGSPHRGVLSADDMARWQPTVEAPLTYDYGRYTVCKPGVWSQGPVMLQQLALLKGFDLDGLDPDRPRIHPSADRVRQARLRRPREVLRRPGIRRRADRDAAVGRLQRRAPQADLQRQGLARFAPRLGRGLRRGR